MQVHNHVTLFGGVFDHLGAVQGWKALRPQTDQEHNYIFIHFQGFSISKILSS